MKIYIDGDGCPVISEIIEISKKYCIETIIVKDYNHEININNEYFKIITVEQGSDFADIYIANNISKSDLLITNDIGLASMVLNKNINILNFNGLKIEESNIEYLLFTRHLGKVNRKNKIYISKFKKRTTEDNLIFERNLTELIDSLKEKKNDSY